MNSLNQVIDPSSPDGPNSTHLPAVVIGSGTEEPQSAVPLRLVAGDTGREIHVRQSKVVIGRHSEADWQLAQPEVSRFHCRLFFTAPHWCAQDLGSLNGTLVNGRRIECVTLRQNDVLRIADYLFQ